MSRRTRHLAGAGKRYRVVLCKLGTVSTDNDICCDRAPVGSRDDKLKLFTDIADELRLSRIGWIGDSGKLNSPSVLDAADESCPAAGIPCGRRDVIYLDSTMRCAPKPANTRPTDAGCCSVTFSCCCHNILLFVVDVKTGVQDCPV